MRTDQATFGIATRVSLGGAALQIVAGATLLIYAAAVKDDVALAASFYVLLGALVWGTLVVLFHQHKLERLEALETEQIAAQAGRSTSVFELSADELNAAAGRLRNLYRFLVPIVSIIMAAGLIALGLWQYNSLGTRLEVAARATGAVQQLRYATGQAASWGLALSAAIAIILFIFSRYVSGMSRQPAWQNLRGGASTSVGAAILGALLALAYGLVITGNDLGIRVLARVVPIFIVAAGVEIAINFILNLYRPRKPGEYPRPAFDSRILSLFAAPDSVVKSINDAINYQFGFQITSTWAYRLMARLVLPLIAFSALILVVLNCAAIVQPYEQGVLTRFGRLLNEEHVYTSGIVFKWPWDRLETYPVYRVQEVLLGPPQGETDPTRPILWGESHSTVPEDLIIVGPMSSPVSDVIETEENRVARNYAVLNAEVPVQYRIKPGIDESTGRPGLLNYVNFIGGDPEERSRLVEAIATRAINRHAASLRLDEILGSGRRRLAGDLRRVIQSDLDSMNAGIDVVFVGLAGIHPPVSEQHKVVEAFEDVLQASEERLGMVQDGRRAATSILAEIAGDEAKARILVDEINQLGALDPQSEEYAQQQREVEELLLQAGGTAAKRIYDAKAERWESVLGQLARTIRQNSRLARYSAAPKLYRAREYFDRLVTALEGQRIYIVPPGVPVRTTLDLMEDPTDLGLGIDATIEQYNKETGG